MKILGFAIMTILLILALISIVAWLAKEYQ